MPRTNHYTAIGAAILAVCVVAGLIVCVCSGLFVGNAHFRQQDRAEADALLAGCRQLTEGVSTPEDAERLLGPMKGGSVDNMFMYMDWRSRDGSVSVNLIFEHDQHGRTVLFRKILHVRN